MAFSRGALFFGTVGGLIGGPVGGIVGAVVGYLIDPNPLFEEESGRAKFGSVEPNLADEGTPISYAYGRHNRIGAQLIYASHPWVIQSGGGGSGKRGEPTQVTWYADLIYASVWNRTLRTAKLVLDSDTVYLANPIGNVSYIAGPVGSQIVAYLDEQNTLVRWQWDEGAMRWELVAWTMTIENHPTNGPGGGPLEQPTLARFIVGEDATLQHFLPGGNQVPNIVNATLMVGKVLDSRVTGVASNGTKNTRLVIDMMTYVNFVNNALSFSSPFVLQVGTGAPPNGRPPTLASLTFNGQPIWPLRPFPFGPGASTLQIQQSGEQFVEGALDPTLTEFRNGGIMPGPSSLYEARVGIGDAPALPRVSMVAAAAVKISRFGNRYPTATVFVDESWEVAGQERTTDYILSKLLSTHGGIPATSINLADHTPQEFLGISFAGTQPTANLVSPILLGFDLYLEESDFLLKVKDRTNLDQIPVDHGHLDARPRSSSSGPKLEFHEGSLNQLPNRVHVKFIDRERNMDSGDVFAMRDVVGGVENDVTRQFTLNYTMHQHTATAVAQRLLRDLHEQNQSVQFRLPCYYTHITESDILVITQATSSISVPYLGQEFYIHVTRIDIGPDFFVEGEGTWLGEATVPEEFLEVSVGDEDSSLSIDVGRPDREDVVRKPSTFNMVSMDIAPLTDEDASRSGFYIGTSKLDAFNAPIGHLYRRLSGGDGWHHVGPATFAATIGQLKTPMPGGVYGVFNYGSYVDVEVIGGEEFGGVLETSTEDGVRGGANLCMIGSEICAFVQATDLSNTDSASPKSARRFRLSGFLRGLLGTDQRINDHATANEDFMLLKPGAMGFVPVQMALAGTRQQYKVVPGDGNTEDGSVESINFVGNSNLSAPVANLTAVRKGNGDVDFSWLRRTRARHRVLGQTDGPLLEVTESYDIVINPDSTNRTINASTTSETYTDAMQTTDSTNDTELVVHVYQLDSVRGRGRVATLAVPATAATWQDENGTDDLITEDGRNLMTEN